MDLKGSPVVLHGVNWFGFNNGQTFLEGLWEEKGMGRDANIHKDFAHVVLRLKLLGFNAVRLPFSFRDFDMPRSRIKSFSFNCTWLPLEKVWFTIVNTATCNKFRMSQSCVTCA